MEHIMFNLSRRGYSDRAAKAVSLAFADLRGFYLMINGRALISLLPIKGLRQPTPPHNK